tara:strand:- start:1708 stop:2181 length:474 start_codon:yes stop_codon:yes gene_type:complete
MYGPFGSLVGAMAHRTPIFEHVFGMLTDLRKEGVLPRRYLELALVAVSKLNACDYCIAHHAPFLAVEGVTPLGTENILEYENHPEFDEIDKLVVQYSIEVSNNFHRVRDELFDQLQIHFSEKQIVELTWRIALCGAFNRFNDVLQLDLEKEALAKIA